jgi:hypothetical protein
MMKTFTGLMITGLKQSIAQTIEAFHAEKQGI